MLFIKKFLMGFGALFLIFIGGAGTQSSSTLLQGGGFIGLILGLIVLYIFAKMAWRAMGCLPSLIIITAVIVFILYAIGIFNGGISNIIPNIKSFIGYSSLTNKTSVASPSLVLNEQETSEQAVLSENFSSNDDALPDQNDEPQDEDGFLDSLFGNSEKISSIPDPKQLPVIYSPVRVSSGDTLVVKGRYFRLFGIDAPESNQSCADANGQAYHCGRQAASWLRSWLQDNEVECRVIKQDANGNMVGICFLGDYDIGAAIVNAGWAVVYSEHTNIYAPYQTQAQNNLNGLWQGKFYMPWDWRKIQARKPKIKYIERRPKRKRTLLNPFG